MVSAKPRDPISLFFKDVERSYKAKCPTLPEIKCEKLLIEDHYEVDEKSTVEETLGDMMRVQIIAVNQIKQKLMVENGPSK